MSDRDDSNASIVRRGAANPRGTWWGLLGLLLLVAVYFWLSDSRDYWTLLLSIGLPVAFLAPFVLVLRICNKPLHTHWYSTFMVTTCLLASLLSWWAGYGYAAMILAIVTVVGVLSLKILDPFWYHYHTGVYLTNLGRFAQAEKYLQKAWKRAQKYSADDVRRGVILALMGDWHRVQNRVEEAEDYYRRALPILQENAEKHSVELFTTCNYLGLFHHQRGKHVEAEIYFRQANSVATDHGHGSLVAVAEQNVASALLELENYREAETLLLSAEKKTRHDRDAWLLIINKLGKLHRRTNNLERADEYARQAMSTLEQSPDTSPLVRLGVLGQLSIVCRRQGKLEEAEQLALKTLEIAKTIEDNFRPGRFWALMNLAALYVAKERFADAEPLFREAILLHEQNKLPEDLDWAEDLEHFAALLRKTNRDEEAADWQARAQSIRRYWREYQAAPRVKEERIKAQSTVS